MQHLSLGNDVLQSGTMVKIEKIIVLIKEDFRRLKKFYQNTIGTTLTYLKLC